MLARKQKELKKLQDEKLDLENLSLAAATAHTKFEQMADDAKNARDAFAAAAAARDAEIPCARVGANHKTRCEFPILAEKLIASAIEISQASPAPADAKYAEFATINTPKGPVEDFIKFNLGKRPSIRNSTRTRSLRKNGPISWPQTP